MRRIISRGSKRWIAILLTMVMAAAILPLNAIAAVEFGVQIVEDFEGDDNIAIAKAYQQEVVEQRYEAGSGAGAKGTDGYGALVNRGHQYCGIMFDLSDFIGNKVEVDVWLRSAQANTSIQCNLMLVISGGESYPQVFTAAGVSSSEWKNYTGSGEIPAYADEAYVYFETNAGTMDIYVDELVVTARESEIVYEDTSDYDSLKSYYADYFNVGMAVTNGMIKSENHSALIANQFNSITLENECKPENLFAPQEEQNDNEKPVLNFEAIKAGLDFAKDNGMVMRGHTLLWHSQTPNWLFYETYDVTGQRASRETMLKRMENYIKGVMEWTQENYPGVIEAWDVVNEAVNDDSGTVRTEVDWYIGVGSDYITKAFEYARKYAADDVKLFYNDYNTYQTAKQNGILTALEDAKAAGTVDGVGMQGHLSVYNNIAQFIEAMEKYSEAGYEVHVTELDITTSNDVNGFQSQADFYSNLFKAMIDSQAEGTNLTSVTVWGISDDQSWKSYGYPLLFNEDLSKKPAFDALIDLGKQLALKDLPALQNLFADYFSIGVAIPSSVYRGTVNNVLQTEVLKHYNSVTLENDFKPAYIFDANTSRSNLEKYGESPALTFNSVIPAMEFCSENNLQMRGHTLVWFDQTNADFFYDNYDSRTGNLVGRELLLKRMENYIKGIMEWIEENYSGIIYAWDVVNEAIDDRNYNGDMAEWRIHEPGAGSVNYWWQVLEEDYVYYAFKYARKYAPDGVKLYYNDYNAFHVNKSEGIYEKILVPLAAEDLIDGMGMQAHLAIDVDMKQYADVLRRYSGLGLEISLTELDVGIYSQEDIYDFEAQGGFYATLFETLIALQREGIEISNVTLWGIHDGISWKNTSSQGWQRPLLFNADLTPKPGFWRLVEVSSEAAKVDAARSDLQKLIAEAETLDENVYTEDSWSVFSIALQSAKNVYANGFAAIDEIEAAKNTLEDAKGTLLEKTGNGNHEEELDWTELEAILKEAELMRGYIEEGIIVQDPDSLQEFQNAYEAAKGLYNTSDKDVEQSQIDAAVLRLSDAISDLRLKADKSKLANVLAKAAEILNEELDIYTKRSIKTLQAAYRTACLVMADESLSQLEQEIVDKAEKDLQDAINALSKKILNKKDPIKAKRPGGLGKNDKLEDSGNKYAKSVSVKTGDSNDIVYYLLALTLAAVCIAAVAYKKKLSK